MNARIAACAILLASAGLMAGEAPDSVGTAGEYWVILIPDAAAGDHPSEHYYEMSVYRMPGEPEVSHAAMLSSLCVSHTLVGQFRHAQRHCDAALEQVRGAQSEGGGTTTGLALAYSNRGVLRARAADVGGAEEDFRAALELQPEAGIPARNLARLKAQDRLSGLIE